MSCCLRTALVTSLSTHLVLSKSRLETLGTLIIGLIHGRSVNLTHIASHCRGSACYASKYRRLQRFSQHVRLDQAVIAALVVRMLNLARPKCLALDRTNWKIGRHDVNILMLAIVTRRFRVPLFWTVLRHQGNSNTAQRIALLKQYLALFEPGSIEFLLAEREFIGAAWFNFLIEAEIPFAIRVRSELTMSLPDGRPWSIESLLRNKRARRTIHTLDLVLPDTALTVKLAAKRLASGEWLIVMTNTAKPKRALQLYRRRWGIECLFGDAKARGLNLEDTHLTDPAKIELLVVILTLAMTWVYKTATATMGLRSIPRKAHAPERPMAGARNPGSAPASTPCATPSSMPHTTPRHGGPRAVQNAARPPESCTVISACPGTGNMPTETAAAFTSRAGRPKAAAKRVPISPQIDPDVLETFKATGPGWQTRMHDVLPEAARTRKAA